MFNDILGTTLGADGPDGYDPAVATAFGDSLDSNTFFTGKPHVDGLGYAFLFRNYRPELGKWQTADPLGYPDGWNRLAYCGNNGIEIFDMYGCFGLVESLVQNKAKEYINNYLNTTTVNQYISSFSSTPADDLTINGEILANIENISITYTKTGAGPTTTSITIDPKNINVDARLKRSQPNVYKIRNMAGDRDGPSVKISQTDFTHISIDNLSISDSIGPYTVTVTAISFDLKLSVDIKSRSLNYRRE